MKCAQLDHFIFKAKVNIALKETAHSNTSDMREGKQFFFMQGSKLFQCQNLKFFLTSHTAVSISFLFHSAERAKQRSISTVHLA